MKESVRELLKTQTAALHSRAELSLERPAKIETQQGLGHFLACMMSTHLRFHSELDRAAREAGIEARSETLINALAADLGCAPNRTSRVSLSDCAYCLGVGYVIEGSALGAGILRKRLARTELGVPRYLSLLTEDAKYRWPRYIEALETGINKKQSVLVGAKSTFEFIIDQAEQMT